MTSPSGPPSLAVLDLAIRQDSAAAYTELLDAAAQSETTLERLRGALLDRLRSDSEPREMRRVAALLTEVEAIRRHRLAYRMSVYRTQVTGLRSLLTGLHHATAAEHPYAVTERLCTDLGFRKAVYSPASRTGWSPTTIAFHPSIANEFRPLKSAIEQLSLPRGAAPREESVMRSGRSIVVEPKDVYRDTYRPLVELSRPRGYLTVPVVAAGRITAILHADHDEIEIAESDLTALHNAAEICGVAEERTALRARIAARHNRAGDALRALSQALHEIEQSRLSLADTLAAESTARRDRPAPLDCCGVLSTREHEIFAAIARGASNADVAQRLFIAEGTVKSHVRRIYRKLNLTSRAEAAALLRRRHADADADDRR